MKYERMLFGMKISDATSIAKCIKSSETLTTLVLQSNLIDDDLLRMLMTGLIKNGSITHLDVSHNKITNHGARLLSKLLGSKSLLTSLNLCDNQIHAEGGRYLGRGLRHNSSLVSLNLRLNRLTDEGGRMLFEGLGENTALAQINLSSNSIGSESSGALCSLLRNAECPITVLDLSCNDFNDEDADQLTHAMRVNRSVCSISRL
jgi:Ran GTPase-activating protein (RanGAP) involved in mRNA processing and transport